MGLELNIINIYLTSWLQGHLVSIHSEAENQFIYNSFRDSVGRSLWIGALKVNSNWTWSDGTPWDYDKWIANNPSGDGNCAEFFILDKGNTDAGTWNDLPCPGWLNKYLDSGVFVCQKKTSDCEEQ